MAKRACVPAPQRTARIEDDIWDPAQERAKAEGATLGALMRAAVERYASGELTSTAEPASQDGPELTSEAGVASQPASHAAAAIASIGQGEPSPGTACAGPGCWQRNTSRYGPPPRTPLPACVAALQGQVYQRPMPESAAHLLKRGAA